jgi:holin-like protein
VYAIATSLRRALQASRPAQILLLIGFWLAGDQITRWSGLPVPGGLVGMGLVLALLATGRLRLPSLERGASLLLAEMLLFFIPAVMAVLDHRELLGVLGLKLLVVILAGTLMVMLTTALTVDLCLRWQSSRDHPRHPVAS